MSGKRRTRSTAQQLKLLTDFMQTHPRLAHGEFSGPQGRLNENRQWEELRAMLSEHGPDKSIDQWKVTWRDLRRKARTEGSVARRAANSTGNATEVPILTDQTKKILGIMGTEGAFGIQGGEESGIGSTPAALSDISTQVQTLNELSFDENESFTQLEYNACSEVVGSSNAMQESLYETAQDPSLPRARPSTSEQQRPGLAQQNPLDLLQTAQDPSQPRARPSTNEQQRPRLPQQNPRVRTPATSTTTTNELQQRQRRRQDPRARANQFLEVEVQNNNILRDVANQLAIANRHSAIHSRFTYKEKLWRLRKDLFK